MVDFSRDFLRPHFSREMSRKTISHSREKCEKCAPLIHTVSTFLHKIFLRPNYFLLPNFVAEFGEDNCYEDKIVQEFQKYLPKFGVDSSAIYCEFFHLEYGQNCNKEKVRNITSVHDDRFSVNV